VRHHDGDLPVTKNKKTIPDKTAGCGMEQLLSRARLIARWRHGSDSFFWRAEADGLLVPIRDGRHVRYLWPAVFRFEGGLPPKGFETAYMADLMTPEEVARRAEMSRDTILRKAKCGSLSARRVGLSFRFVPAEVDRWMATWT